MNYTKRDKDKRDLPSIWYMEGRYLLGLGNHTWRKAWHEVYKHEVYCWEESTGTKVNLDSLIGAVFPDLRKNPQAKALLTIDILSRITKYRIDQRAYRLAKRLQKENGGGTS